MKKEFQEETALTPEEEEFLTLELREEEEDTTPRFTLKQKLILIGTGLFSFLVFTVLAFSFGRDRSQFFTFLFR